jgi:PKD repeat protein
MLVVISCLLMIAPVSAQTVNLTGTIMNMTNSQPMANTNVTFQIMPMNINVTTETDNRGYFDLSFDVGPNINSFPIMYSARTTGYASIQSAPVIVNPGSNSLGFIQVFPVLVPITLTGTVVDKFTGLPVPNMEIHSDRISDTSKQDGSFTLFEAPEIGGSMEFRIYADGYYVGRDDTLSVSEDEMARGSKDLGTVTITPHFGGYVTDKSTGQPLSGVQLIITNDPSSQIESGGAGTSDETGYYRMRLRAEGISSNNSLRNTGADHSVRYLVAVKDGYQSYTANVTIRDEEAPFNVALSPSFAANFLALGHVGQAPYSVRFMDQSTGSPTAWTWEFGDGTTSTDQNPTHIYNQTGVYNVALTASNEKTSDTCTQYRCIIVNAVPVAAFTANATAGQTPFTVQFTDQSTSGADGYQWQFGDGTTSTDQNPVHTYTSPGSYSVMLTVSVPDYGSVFTQKTGYISVSGPSSVGFTANVTAGLSPLAVQFTESTNESVQYSFWHFGDGATSAEQNPVHVYDAAGRYTVSLMTVGSNGTEVKTVDNFINVSAPVTPTVTPTATATTTVTPTPTGALPVANFTVTTGVPGSSDITVTDASTNATSVRYSLGDGATTAYPTFRYTYWQAGTYTIEQTATNAAGSSKKSIVVTVPVAAPTTTTVTPTVTVTTTVSPTVTTTGQAYNGPHTIPGTLQAEDYDLGGEGVAYHDTTAGNEGGVYRHDDVDIEQLDTDGSPNVGWIRAGEWMGYTVNVASTGTYTAGFRVASSHSGSTIKVYVDDGTTPVATVNVPNTGNWPVFQTVSVPVTLPAGQHQLKLSFPTDYVNINWVSFA